MIWKSEQCRVMMSNSRGLGRVRSLSIVVDNSQLIYHTLLVQSGVYYIIVSVTVEMYLC